MADDHKEFDCSKCTEKEKEERGCVETIDYMYNEKMKIGYWYSEEREDLLDKGSPIWSDGEYYCYCCPVACITEESQELMSLYNLCKDLTCLPRKGGLYDQPLNIIQAFGVISSEINRKTSEEREKIRSESNRNVTIPRKGR